MFCLWNLIPLLDRAFRYGSQVFRFEVREASEWAGVSVFGARASGDVTVALVRSGFDGDSIGRPTVERGRGVVRFVADVSPGRFALGSKCNSPSRDALFIRISRLGAGINNYRQMDKGGEASWKPSVGEETVAPCRAAPVGSDSRAAQSGPETINNKYRNQNVIMIKI